LVLKQEFLKIIGLDHVEIWNIVIYCRQVRVEHFVIQLIQSVICQDILSLLCKVLLLVYRLLLLELEIWSIFRACERVMLEVLDFLALDRDVLIFSIQKVLNG
jgi:hypothetical protein